MWSPVAHAQCQWSAQSHVAVQESESALHRLSVLSGIVCMRGCILSVLFTRECTATHSTLAMKIYAQTKYNNPRAAHARARVKLTNQMSEIVSWTC